jgi:hypothetical protein
MTYSYTVYGLTLGVPFPCPELTPATEDAAVDVVVEYGPVPRRLEPAVVESDRWDVQPGRFLWRGGPRAGRFLVEGGRRVILKRNAAAEDDRLRAFLLASVLAALLQQRGLLVLHADAVVLPTGAGVAVAGESGSGKTPTAAALIARGCSMLANDIVALRADPERGVMALPGIPRLHAWEDAAAALGRDPDGLARHPLRRGKVVVPLLAEASTEAAPLRFLCLLRSGSRDGVRARRLAGAERFAAVNESVHGPLLPEEHPAAFPLMARVAEDAAIWLVEHPHRHWSADEVARTLLAESV